MSAFTEIAPRIPFDQGAPVINGPAVFGFSPGKPCLFTFPVCGERPLEFTVEGDLPGNITLDPSTGSLSGTCTAPGKYSFRVNVSNALGSATKDFTLCVEKDKLCLTPLLGWTSWNAFANTKDMNQESIARTADLMVSTGLAARGYSYINIDSSWQGKRSTETRALQSNSRFPDMKSLTDHIHSLGLKAGIYSTPMAVAWGSTDFEYYMGSTGYPLDPDHYHEYFGGCGKTSFVEQDARQWAQWGFDYLKYDWPSCDLVHTEEMSRALRATDRDFVLCLCTWCKLESINQYKKYANLYRSNHDTTDTWSSISGNCFTVDVWAQHIEPGAWFDMDMLALGDMALNNYIPTTEHVPNRLTRDEQITHVSAWALFPSPIQISCDLGKLDDFLLDLLSNEEILAVNQDYPAKGAVCIQKSSTDRIYRRELSDGTVVYGIFNTGDTPCPVTLTLDREYSLRDLWARRDLGTAKEISMVIPVHGARIIAAGN